MKYNNVYDVHDVIFLLLLILTQNNQQVKNHYICQISTM